MRQKSMKDTNGVEAELLTQILDKSQEWLPFGRSRVLGNTFIHCMNTKLNMFLLYFNNLLNLLKLLRYQFI